MIQIVNTVTKIVKLICVEHSIIEKLNAQNNFEDLKRFLDGYKNIPLSSSSQSLTEI